MSVYETMRKLAESGITAFLLVDTTNNEEYYYDFSIEWAEHHAFMYHYDDTAKRVLYKNTFFKIYY